MFKHLKDTGLGYFEHAIGALDGAKTTFTTTLILITHAIYPDIFSDDATEMLKEKIRKLKKMKDNSTQTDSISINIDLDEISEC